jgi:glycosyltransferase involved in cell wall biosynthesis
VARIAVVTPRPVPFVEGGNERHWRSFVAALVEAGHDADLIEIESPESTLADVLASYRRFAELDLSDHDAVVSGKYPSFMVEHPCHVRHLNHLLRGLQDRYPQHLPTAPDRQTSDFLGRFDDARGRSAATEVIDWAEQRLAADSELAEFPGPFARAVIGQLDRIGRNGLIAEAAVSETVARRDDHVDPSRPISIISPGGDLVVGAETVDARPARLVSFGRLDRTKRFDLILAAWRRMERAEAELVVVGDGPDLARLRAEAPDGVHFAGRLTDGALAATLSSARAVVLVPEQEDFGLVAAEAKAAGCPVVTVSDSGGVAEQVEHGVTGLIADPTPRALARACAALLADPALAARMGRAARDSIDFDHWAPLIDLVEAVIAPVERPRLLVLSTFPPEPVRHGGQRRLRGLARQLAVDWQVSVLSLTNSVSPGEGIRRRRLADGVIDVRVARSKRQLKAEFEMASLAGTAVDDIACSVLWPTSPSFAGELGRRLAESDAVMLSHPFLAGALPDHLEIPVVYDAHNVERDLKKQTLGQLPGGGWLTEAAARAEALAIERADLVLAASQADLDRLGELHRLPAHSTVVANPASEAMSPPRTDQERIAARTRFFADLGAGDDGRPLVVFVGSDHPPNRAAVRRIGGMADAADDLRFVVAGSVDTSDLSPRVTVLGRFPASAERRLLAMADVVVNPVEQGSGTNLKVIDALTLGVPVVSTAIGARGLDHPLLSVADDTHAIIERVRHTGASGPRPPVELPRGGPDAVRALAPLREGIEGRQRAKTHFPIDGPET